VGSQVFWEDVFERSVMVMMAFIRTVHDRCGYLPEELDLGGGYGVRYVESDPEIHIPRKIASVAETLYAIAKRLDLPVPKVLMEPGRSIVADAGMTLYTVGSVKEITGYKRYVSIDGGMSDNPRYALYGSQYTCFNASRMDEPSAMRCDLVGRCCESGDVIQPDILLPNSTQRGDVVAVCTTGAYNFSMASGYNRMLRPPVVMLKEGRSYVAVGRETLDDMIRLDQ
jgi:diaminopimelate decarboxylase